MDHETYVAIKMDQINADRRAGEASLRAYEGAIACDAEMRREADRRDAKAILTLYVALGLSVAVVGVAWLFQTLS